MANMFPTLDAYLSSLEDKLKDNAPVDSGSLRESISLTQTNSSEALLSLAFEMNSYGEIIDKGVNGTEKNWGSPYSFSTKIPPPSSFAKYTASKAGQFAIATSIFKKGIKPRNFIDPVLNNAEDTILKLGADDLSDYIYDLVNKEL